MPRIHLAKAALATLLALPLSAQVPQPTPKAKTMSAAKPKLTPQQRTGLSILDQQAGVAKGLSPVMRTFALMEIARGYEKLNQTKALATLRAAFQASQSIEDDSDSKKSTKTWLQGQVLGRLVALDPAYCEQLVPQLAGPARMLAINRLVTYHTRKRQFPQAIALLTQLGDQEFPYIIGSNLVQALPPEMAADRQNLFAEALASFSQHEHKDQFGPDDFGVFITRTWQGLPPDLVLQAVDEALKQARQSDTKAEITVGAAKGTASFSSLYEYTLFALMPVLRALDSERADRLLQEDRDLQTAARQYPNGLQSLDPENGIPDSITMRLPSNSGESPADDRYEDQLQPQIRQIIAQSEKNPKQAVAAAMSLPDFHNTRALALLRLAGAILKTSPGYAANALDELMKIIPSIQREIVQFDMLAGAGDDYQSTPLPAKRPTPRRQWRSSSATRSRRSRSVSWTSRAFVTRVPRTSRKSTLEAVRRLRTSSGKPARTLRTFRPTPRSTQRTSAPKRPRKSPRSAQRTAEATVTHEAPQAS